MGQTQTIACSATIDTKIGNINNLLHLSDGRIAAISSLNKYIHIIDPSNQYQVAFKIELDTDEETSFDECFFSLSQLENGLLIAGTYKGSIKIYSLTKDSYKLEHTIKGAYNKEVRNILPFPNNQFATFSWKDTIDIWNGIAPYSTSPVESIKLDKCCAQQILYIKEKEAIVICSTNNHYVYDHKNKKFIGTIPIEMIGIRCAVQIDSDRIVTGGMEFMAVINISTMTVENKIIDKGIFDYHDLIKLNDKVIVGGCDCGYLVVYNVETKEFTKVRSSIWDTFYYYTITTIAKVDGNSLIVGATDNYFRVWKY